MADNIAYSPTHPAVGNVAWQPAGPYATIAYANDGYSATPMVGYPSVYPHVLNIPPRINAFADLAMTPMYQPDPQIMQWYMQMMTEAMKALSAPMSRGSSAPAKAAPAATTQRPQGSKEGVSNVTANVGGNYALSPMGVVSTDPAPAYEPQSTPPAGGGGGGVGAGEPVETSGNSIIGGPTGLLDIIAQSGAPAAPAVPSDISDATRALPWWYPLWHSMVSR